MMKNGLYTLLDQCCRIILSTPVQLVKQPEKENIFRAKT
jgi:hypothetical protein